MSTASVKVPVSMTGSSGTLSTPKFADVDRYQTLLRRRSSEGGRVRNERPRAGMKSMRVPSGRSIHQSPRSHHYGRAPLGFGLTRYPYGLTLVRRPMSRFTRHHWSGGVLGRPVSAGRPLTDRKSTRLNSSH